MGHVEHKLCYNITINTMFTHYDTPFQYSVFRKVPIQSLFNFVHHIMTPNFEDDELWKIIILYLGKYYIFNI